MTLFRRLVAAVPWIPWVPTALGIASLVWATKSLQADFGSRQLYLRGGLLLAALALAFAFDDPAAETTDPSPSPLWVRRSTRLLIALAPWALLVTVLLVTGARNMDPVMVLSQGFDPLEFPVGRLLLEAATMGSWGLATASLLASRREDEPGKIASGVLLVLYGAAWMVPERWKPWAHPTDSRWTTANLWWWVALGLGLLAIGAFGWDSRRGSGWRRFRAWAVPAGDDTQATIDPSECNAVRG
jgi:hypothetical protein